MKEGFTSVVVIAAVMEGVLVALAVGVKVEVDVRVEVDVLVVDISVGVADGVGVEGGVTGLGKKINAAIRRTMSARIEGRTYLRNLDGRMAVALSKGVTTGDFPVYPSADKRFLKLSAYSPLKKLT